MTKAPRKAPQVPGEQGEQDSNTQEPDTRGAGLDLDALDESQTTSTAGGFVGEQGDAAVNTESDVDEAIALAQSGQARPIIKPRAPVAPARLTRPDPSRPPGAAVNQAPVMSYEEAIHRKRAGEELARLQKTEAPTEEQLQRMAILEEVALKRSVLTEQGWVVVDKAPPAETKR